jgi:hypothetical protein
MSFGDRNQEATEIQQIQLGPMDQWSVHVAELVRIFYAISLVYKLAHQNERSATTLQASATILGDSMSALQAIRNPATKLGQRVIHAILQVG